MPEESISIAPPPVPYPGPVSGLAQQISNLEHGAAEARQDRVRLENRLQEKEREIDLLKQEALEAIEEGEAEIAALKQKLAGALTPQMAADLRREMERYKLRFEQEEGRALALLKEKRLLEVELSEVRATAGEVGQARLQAKEASAKAAEWEARCQVIQREGTEAVEEGEAELRKVTETLARVKETLGQTEKNLETSRSERARLEKQIHELQEELERRKAFQGERERLKQDVDAAAVRLEAAECREREAAERVRTLEAESERKLREAAQQQQAGEQDAGQRLAEAREQARLQESKTADLLGQLQAALARADAAERRAAEAAEGARLVGTECTGLRRDLERLREEGTGGEALRQRQRAMEEELNALRARVAREEEDWQGALETVDRYKADFERSDHRVHELEADAAAQRRELEARQRETQMLKEQISTLQGTLSMQRSELTRLRAEQQPPRGGGDAEWMLTALATLAQVRTGRAEGAEALRNLVQPLAAPPPAVPPAVSEGSALAVVRAGAGGPPVPEDPEQSGALFAPTGHHLRQLEQVDLEGDVRLTLDQLRCAVLDSQWREKWIAGENPPVFNGPSARFRGKPEEVFYDILRRFLEWLADPVGAANAAGFGEKELWQCMYDLHAAETLNRMVARNDFAGTNYVSRRLRAFSRRLAHLKDRAPSFHAWTDVLAATHWDVARAVFPLRERRLVVSGRCHGLRLHPSGGLEMAAWKVEPEASEGEDHRELALLALVFSKAHPERPLYYLSEVYTQDVEVREVARATLNRELREHVVPVFYDLAGMFRPEALRDPGLEFFVDPQTTEIVD